MEQLLAQIRSDMNALVNEWTNNGLLKKDDVFVIGCSTSEVAGKTIGTSGSEEIAAILFNELKTLREQTGVHLAFQCCEHLNRALVVERETMEKFNYEQVSVIPVREAGGAMTAYAYNHFDEAVVVEDIEADAGIDIGDTLIGMHLRKVAVPVRLTQNTVGSARIIGARTRPKLIGGARAQYK
mgnify:CR=1 FL=1